jgi:hypothetical protein
MAGSSTDRRDAVQPRHRDPSRAGHGHRGPGRPGSQVGGVSGSTRAARLDDRRNAGIEGDGFIVPEVGRLLEFLEFLNLKDRFGG